MVSLRPLEPLIIIFPKLVNFFASLGYLQATRHHMPLGSTVYVWVTRFLLRPIKGHKFNLLLHITGPLITPE